MIKNPNVIQGSTIGIEDEQSLDGATLGSEVTWKIPPRIGVISVSVKLPSETGNVWKLEYTNSPTSRVDAGTAIWFDHYGADQSLSRIGSMYGALSAVRVTRVSGNGTLVAAIRGQ